VLTSRISHDCLISSIDSKADRHFTNSYSSEPVSATFVPQSGYLGA